MADMLKGYGVTHVFHVPAVLRRSFVEMERRTDIKRLHVHGEKSAGLHGGRLCARDRQARHPAWRR